MEIKVPEVGESIYEGLLVKWHKRNGEMVLG
jgi:pyruvate/2-oxoglutarate dehydrogenase complex dihydrolipoamide acyltransferase (E2) component